MRIRIVAMTAVCSLSSAFADPAPGPQAKPCGVTILRAPERVREEVEASVRAEPRCTTSLELRVVPTDGGLYLMSRDDQGRVRERVVPDAQSVAVLVASWISDDAAPPVAPSAVPATAQVAAALPAAAVQPPVAASPPAVAVSPGPPGLASPAPPFAPLAIEVTRLTMTTSAPSGGTLWEPARRWLTMGGVHDVAGHADAGLRIDLDVIGRSWWAMGVSVSVLDGSAENVLQSTTTAQLFWAATVTHARWQIRLQLGVGASLARITEANYYYEPDHSHHFGAIAESSLLLGRELGDHWALAAGPVASTGINAWDNQPTVMVFAGFRHQL